MDYLPRPTPNWGASDAIEWIPIPEHLAQEISSWALDCLVCDDIAPSLELIGTAQWAFSRAKTATATEGAKLAALTEIEQQSTKLEKMLTTCGGVEALISDFNRAKSLASPGTNNGWKELAADISMLSRVSNRLLQDIHYGLANCSESADFAPKTIAGAKKFVATAVVRLLEHNELAEGIDKRAEARWLLTKLLAGFGHSDTERNIRQLLSDADSAGTKTTPPFSGSN